MNYNIKNLLILNIFIVGLVLLGSCEDMGKPSEMRIEDMTVSNITGTSAVVKINKNDITNGYFYVKYPESTYLYYGTSSNVSEMKDYVAGHAEGSGLLKSELTFNLNNLNPGTQYWYALRVDTIYASGASHGISLVNDQGYHGYLIPSNNTFTTVKDLPPVDLGLSVLWAQCNLGVDEIWFGHTYTWCVTKYSGNDKPTARNIAGTVQDHVTAIMGDEWHTPTVSEFTELIENCDWELKMNQDWGAYIRFTSRINGNHIDMYPFNGGMLANWEANYWTANCDLGNSDSSLWKVYQFTFSSLQEHSTEWITSEYYGINKTAQIRPVKKK